MAKSSTPGANSRLRPKSPVRASPPSSAWGKGRELLVQAARELFAEKGYAGTSTRELAARASVTEAMLFRHFGSKAGLFREVAFAQFSEFIDEFVDDWEHRPHGVRDPVDEARDFLRGVYDVLHANREMVEALIAADNGNGPLASEEGPGPWLAAILERFEPIALREGENRHWRKFDPKVMTRILFGMGLAASVLDMKPGKGVSWPAADDMIEEMAQLIIHGVEDRPRGKR
ncbi:TetR/AcrR family transcriptional regulator [Mycobacterium sp.]|uniref:TetR/AcrR family transcriptional regulator n=1 Tax=Mycobacterium sp. TaxID=1785 RepID=UPI0012290407|nr:TetR/AcrR family transcriptional regulator [Mycobacterium sp.]TAM69766.1 MAG: TetR/AcrR family transcriptional regulator [Mycobacterium sp.]